MRLTTFSGQVPKLDGQDLPPNGALVAENCDLYSGRIDPFPVPGGQIPLVGVDGWAFDGVPATVYKAGDVWVAWPKHVFVVPDFTERAGANSFLFVEDGELRRSSAAWLAHKHAPVTVGVPPPEQPPQAVASSGVCARVTLPALQCVTACERPDGDDVPGELRAYVLTYVTESGEESAPSPPTEPVVVRGDEGVILLDPNSPPARVTARRWYRAVSGTDGQAIWLLAGETPVSALAFTDCVDSLGLGGPMDTEAHLPPPGCLEGVALLGGTSVVVWSGQQFWVSEPRLPHAYPPDWRRQIPQERIVAIVGVQEALEGVPSYLGYIVTTGNPYYVLGEMPEQVSVHKYAFAYPASSPRAVVAAEGALIYASPYGLVRLEGGKVEVVMDAFLTDVEWADWGAQGLHLHHWNGRLWGFGKTKSFVLAYDRVRNDRPPSLVAVTLHPAAAHGGAEGLALALGDGLQMWGQGTGRIGWRRSSALTLSTRRVSLGSRQIAGALGPSFGRTG